MQWKEEVKLQSGEVIIVERSAQFKENWIPGGGGGSINKGMTLSIPVAVNGAPIERWDARFVPILLDRDPLTREWLLVATFFHCDSWYELGRPKLPYTEYRFRQGRWVQQPLSQALVGRAANLFPVDLEDRDLLARSKPALTVDKKAALFFSSPMSPEYKEIVGAWKTSC